LTFSSVFAETVCTEWQLHWYRQLKNQWQHAAVELTDCKADADWTAGDTDATATFFLPVCEQRNTCSFYKH